MAEKEPYPVLYILMRTDLDSMNPGKAMAQASHASNAFVHNVKTKVEQSSKPNELYEKWAGPSFGGAISQGFGTVLVIGVTGKELRDTVDQSKGIVNTSGLVTDPSYPYIVKNEYADLIPESIDTMPRIRKEKETVLFRTEITCGYIFMDKNDKRGQKLISDFNLHP